MPQKSWKEHIFTFDICYKFQYVVCVCMCAGFLGKFTLQCLFFCVPSIMATGGSSSITPSHAVRPKIMEEHISGMWTNILWKACISIPYKPFYKKSMWNQLLHREVEGSRGGLEETPLRVKWTKTTITWRWKVKVIKNSDHTEKFKLLF